MITPAFARTFLVYADGGGGLSQAHDAALASLVSDGAPDDVAVLVRQGDADGHVTDYRVTTRGERDGGAAPTVPYDAVHDQAMPMGAADTLRTFLTEGTAAFPSAHVGLAIPAHGESAWGIAQQQMTLPQLHQALAGQHVGLLVFDSCLMQAAEVASELQDDVSTIVASQRPLLVSPHNPSPWIQAFAQAPDPETAARQIALHNPYPRAIAAWSAVRTSAVPALEGALKAFDTQLLGAGNEAFFSAIKRDCQPLGAELLTGQLDLQALMHAVSQDPRLQAMAPAATAVEKAAANVVIAESHDNPRKDPLGGPPDRLAHVHGLDINMPPVYGDPQHPYTVRPEAPVRLRFLDATDWEQVVSRVDAAP